MTALINETRDRIAFAAEGVALGAGHFADAVRDRSRILGGLLLAAAVAGFVLTQAPGASTESTTSADPSSASALVPAPDDLTFVEERGFSLSMPKGWERAATPDGAVFAAASADGAAQTTLWVERDREIAFAAFVTESLSGLETLGTDARIADRVEGPTLETSTAVLRAQVPVDGMAPGPYRVDLRAAGPYRYYLATSLQPEAPARLLADAETIGSSLRPDVALRGVGPAD